MKRCGDHPRPRVRSGLAVSRLARTIGALVTFATFAVLLTCLIAPGPAAAATTLRYFPTGSIYAYRWKLLELVLAYERDTAGEVRLQPYAEDVTQNRGIALMQAGAIDVIALGTNEERERQMRPVRIDILRGIVGFRLLVIRAADQPRIARIDAGALPRQLSFGLNSQWADLPIMRANGYTVVTSPVYENLFEMLAAGRFDAFPRGLNEARRELEERKLTYPQLAIEESKALFFPFPVYFWVNNNNPALAQRIERGLKRALADGSFRRLFESHHAVEIAALRNEKRQVVYLTNPTLPAGTLPPDTRWWWPQASPGE